MIDFIHTKTDYIIFMKKFLLLIAIMVGGLSLTSCSNEDDNLPTLDKEKLIKEGQNFLEENKKKEGVIETKSGLQYKILQEGDGVSPSPTDVVKCHYEGRLIGENGTVFDSSYKRNTPSEFALNHVIKGWTEGLQLMKVGSIYRFFIPYYLAYGDIQVGIIPPYSTLIFDVTLEKVGKFVPAPAEPEK